MENLFIIGNGFDLAHGLPTQFKHFKAYVKSLAKEDEIDELLEVVMMSDVPSDYLSPGEEVRFNIDKLANYYYRLINTLESYARDRENRLYSWTVNHQSKYQDWNGFEDCLGFVTDGIDWEAPLPLFDKEGDIDHFKMAYNNEDDANLFGQFFREATTYFFTEWINSILDTDEYQELFPDKTIVRDWKDQSYFLTFNYTSVLEEIYGISSKQICHIHGQVGGEIIVGHQRQLATSHDNPLDRRTYHEMILEDVRKQTEVHYQTHKSFFDNCDGIKRLIIIGFNLDSPELVDRYYFEKLFSNHIGRQPIEVVFDKYHWQAGDVPTYLDTLTALGANIKSFTVV